MNSFKNFLSQEKYFLVGYLLFSMPVFFFTRCYIDSADLIQYLTLAKQYTQLPLRDCANEFWSPLLSWIIIPFNFLTGDYLLAFKAIQFLISSSLYALLLFSIKGFNLSFTEKLMFSVSSGIMTIGYGIFNGSPDLLYLFVLFLIIRILNKTNMSFASATLIGLMGAMLYFSKSFGLVFFPVFLMVYYYVSGRFITSAWRYYLVAFLVFIALSSVWIIILSNKYQKLTYSGASQYNFSIMNPSYNPNIFGEVKHPIDAVHYALPPNNIAVSAWQEPNNFGILHWSPFNNLYHYFKVILRNLLSLLYYYSYYWVLFFASLLTVFLFSINKRKGSLVYLIKNIFHDYTKGSFDFVKILLISALITSFLYALVLTQKRYLWINEICILFFILSLNLHSDRKYLKVFLGLFTVVCAYSFGKEYYPVLNYKTNIEWRNDPIVLFLKSDKSDSAIISEAVEGADGYTINSALCFFSGHQNLGVQNAESMQKLKFKGYFLSSGNHTINSRKFPFIHFVVYSQKLNYSLYSAGLK